MQSSNRSFSINSAPTILQLQRSVGVDPGRLRRRNGQNSQTAEDPHPLNCQTQSGNGPNGTRRGAYTTITTAIYAKIGFLFWRIHEAQCIREPSDYHAMKIARAGDVHPNPGPEMSICGWCKERVQERVTSNASLAEHRTTSKESAVGSAGTKQEKRWKTTPSSATNAQRMGQM